MGLENFRPRWTETTEAGIIGHRDSNHPPHETTKDAQLLTMPQ